VLASDDKEAILALDADLVLHAASRAFPTNTNSDDIEFDEIRRSMQIATAPEDIDLPAGTIPPGSVAGQILGWTAYRNDMPVLVAEELWTVTDIPQWDLTLDGEFLVRVIVEGAPPLRLELRTGNDRIEASPASPGARSPSPLPLSEPSLKCAPPLLVS
jgi:hypothetical protein